MAVPKSPGTYWERTVFKDKAVPVIGVAANCLMGITERGDVDTPIETIGWDDFVRKCGGFFTPVGVNDQPLAYPAYRYFRNGGSRLYINRVTHHVTNVSQAVKSSLILLDGAVTPQDTLKFEALSPGVWGDNIAITKVDNPRCSTTLASNANPGDTTLSLSSTYGLVVGSTIKINEGITTEYKTIVNISGTTITVSSITGTYTTSATVVSREFNISIYYENILVEEFVQYSMVETDDRYVETIASDYVKAIDQDSGSTPGLDIPADITTQNLTGGDDGLTNLDDTDYVGDSVNKYGFYAFNKRPTSDIRINIAHPSRTSATIVQAGSAFAGLRGNVYYVADFPSTDITAAAAKTFKNSTAGVDSSYVCLIFPYDREIDQNAVVGSNTKVDIPPSINKLLAIEKYDAAIGPWRASAGTDYPIEGIIEQVVDVDDMIQDVLNDANIQCIRYKTGYGFCVWGARTTSSQLRYKYENVPRTIQYIGDTLVKRTLSRTFHPGDIILMEELRDSAESLMSELFSKRAFKGTTKEEAYFILSDMTNNTDAQLDNGIVYCDIGAAFNKPGEFIIFRVGVWEGGGSVTLS